jgi:hypothetical protein
MLCWCGDTECKLDDDFGWRIIILTPVSYVWGDTPAKAKTQCESLDYLFQLAVEMHKLGLPWDINRNQK